MLSWLSEKPKCLVVYSGTKAECTFANAESHLRDVVFTSMASPREILLGFPVWVKHSLQHGEQCATVPCSCCALAFLFSWECASRS